MVTQMTICKYSGHSKNNNEERLFPVLTNQKINACLKGNEGFCEIEKELTHSTRHTFTTNVKLTNGIPIESVSKMLRHKILRTTQHYEKVLDKKLREDIKILRDKFTSVEIS